MADTATGILFIYETGRPTNPITLTIDAMVHFGAPYFAVSTFLNCLLTTMLVTRLTLHKRNIRNAMGASSGAGELYKTTVSILIESSAIFFIGLVLFLATWATRSPAQYIFLQILAQIQVRTIFTGPQTMMRHGWLIIASSRSSLRTSSFYESPTGEHLRATMPTPGTSARYTSRVEGKRRVVECVLASIR